AGGAVFAGGAGSGGGGISGDAIRGRGGGFVGGRKSRFAGADGFGRGIGGGRLGGNYGSAVSAGREFSGSFVAVRCVVDGGFSGARDAGISVRGIRGRGRRRFAELV